MKSTKIFKLIVGILIFVFLCSYFVEMSGYYEYNLQNKTVMTNEAMAQFEKDIADGKDVTLEDYVVTTEKDYTSSLTRTTNKVSVSVNKFLKKGIEGVFKIVGTFVEE